MPPRAARLVAFLLLVSAGACGAGGCALRAPLIAAQLDEAAPRSEELHSTPFFPQRRYQCGPAALATVLAASGVAVRADDLVERVYLPESRGSLQAELIGAGRSFDRLPYRIDPELNAVLGEVLAGRPVLILQNLGLAALPVWHYAVVVGFDASADRLLLRSGTTERLSMSSHRFLAAWQRADRWAVVFLRPGELPVRAVRDRFLEAAAGLESAGRYPAALTAYTAALERWPDSTTALLGIGNVHYRMGALGEAAGDFRRVLEIDAGHAVARNNLAQVLLERGEPDAALREIRAARAALADSRFADLLLRTESDILKALESRALRDAGRARPQDAP